MKKEKQERTVSNLQIDAHLLFEQVVKIVEKRKRQAGSFANREITLMYWEIGSILVQFYLAANAPNMVNRLLRHCHNN
jgi:hypothetical protein